MSNYKGRLIRYGFLSAVVLPFFVFGCTLAAQMKDEADAARKVQDSILREFKRIDESLQQSNLSIDSFNNDLKKKVQIKL